MRKTLALLIVCGLMAGCGGGTNEAASAERGARSHKAKKAAEAAAAAGEAPATTEAAKPMPATAPAAPAPEVKQPDTAVAPAPAAPAEAADPAVQKLIGTSWSMPDGVEFTFKDGKTATAKGGMIAAISPSGIPVAYTYKDGKIEFSAMGTKKVGTWDGTTLIVEGATATKK